MASNSDNANNNNPMPLLLPEIGPDGLPRESSVISYTEKVPPSLTSVFPSVGEFLLNIFAVFFFVCCYVR